MYSRDSLIVLDADGTTIDAFTAIEKTFAHHGMDIGDLKRFQKRRKLFKYLGGLKEFPKNLKKQLGKQQRSKLIDTLTDVYREEASLYPELDELIKALIAKDGLRVGLITRNITRDPELTLRRLFERYGIPLGELDFFVHVPLKEEKVGYFHRMRERFNINPARAYACGDEQKDFLAAQATGMHPFMVSYGFEDFERLTSKIGVPTELISRSPQAFRARVSHGLELGRVNRVSSPVAREGRSGLYKQANNAHSNIDGRLATSG